MLFGLPPKGNPGLWEPAQVVSLIQYQRLDNKIMNRRNAFRAVAAGVAATAAATVIAKEHADTSASTIETPADQIGLCATCQFWGGVRRVSKDKKTVHSETLGWCNNSASQNFQKKTTPISGPMRNWQKWDALS